MVKGIKHLFNHKVITAVIILICYCSVITLLMDLFRFTDSLLTRKRWYSARRYTKMLKGYNSLHFSVYFSFFFFSFSSVTKINVTHGGMCYCVVPI